MTGRYLGEMVRFCKEELDIESVTVVTNGSRTTEHWMAEYGYYLDIMAVSVDSFVPEVSCRYLHNVSIISTEVNTAIGRRAGPGSDHLASLGRVRGWCRQYGVLFKVGTEISSNIYNIQYICYIYIAPSLYRSTPWSTSTTTPRIWWRVSGLSWK